MTPNTYFPVLRQMSDGLFVISTAGQRDMWTLRKLRKASKCVATGRQLEKGELHYGPITNGDHRGWRIHREYVENEVPNNQF